MSERTVAEIIGWRQDGGDSAYLPFYVKADGTYGHGDPDCDDMLAWLASRDEHDGIETWSDQGGHVVKLWLSMQSWPDEHHAPTLYAALEAAVRSLADVT